MNLDQELREMTIKASDKYQILAYHKAIEEMRKAASEGKYWCFVPRLKLTNNQFDILLNELRQTGIIIINKQYKDMDKREFNWVIASWSKND